MSKFSKTIETECSEIVNELNEILIPLQNKKLLLTGAGGFLGSYILDVLNAFNIKYKNTPCKIIAMDNFLTGMPERIEHLKNNQNIEFIKTDVSASFLIPSDTTYIIHAASVASPTFYRKYPLETIDVNVNGTRTLLEFAKNHPVQSVLYLSTSEIYGDPTPDQIPTNENFRGYVATMGPRACYDESKRLAESLCWIYHQYHSVPVKVARIFNCYGPGQRIDDKRIIPDLMAAAYFKKDIELFSDGKATRSFSYIQDTVKGFFYILMSTHNGDAFNVGNTEESTIQKIAETFQEIIGKDRIKIIFKSSDQTHYLTDNPQRRCPNIDKLKSMTKWFPKIQIKEGLTRTWRSYLESTHESNIK